MARPHHSAKEPFRPEYICMYSVLVLGVNSQVSDEHAFVADLLDKYSQKERTF